MSFLRLSGIGKIYVSEGNVTVGIRGVDLSFERGEFVAVTGASGSGKSTLLNVISGMDSYEEGELYINESATSHYTESDWEDYRSEYISFIFQDYNILESYTVLQNVELALMHITDRKLRRERAVELLRRVGLERHLHKKGSKLSGGQKQRTVIARALAKDSPIILADEPTGNLDEATSKEIIDLLREVSRDKLLIVVTHNFDRVEHCATRHIRVYDGSIEFDRTINPLDPVPGEKKEERAPKKEKKLSGFARTLRDGILLGAQVFFSRPRLAAFSCILMAVGMLGIFVMTSFCFTADMFEKNYIFEPIDGRVVVVRRDKSVPTREEIDALAAKYGAEKTVMNDSVLDERIFFEIVAMDGALSEKNEVSYVGYESFLARTEPIDGEMTGEYPDERGEVMLCLPIGRKERYSTADISAMYALSNGIFFKITGICYYYDNNIFPTVCFTEEGFEFFANFHVALRDGFSVKVEYGEGKDEESFKPSGYEISAQQYEIGISPDSEFDICISPGKDPIFETDKNKNYNAAVSFINENDSVQARKFITGDKIEREHNVYLLEYWQSPLIILGTDLALELMTETNALSYRQFSLFFENDTKAERAAKEMTDDDYIAVPSNTIAEEDIGEMLLRVLILGTALGVWIAAIGFFSFFIALCQSRSVATFKSDIAIMRSMGIPAAVIRISMYMRTVISLVPAAVIVAVSAFFIFRSPSLNASFTYLYPWQYALIYMGMLIMALLISKRQQGKLFAESVKKTLTGGVLND